MRTVIAAIAATVAVALLLVAGHELLVPPRVFHALLAVELVSVLALVLPPILARAIAEGIREELAGMAAEAYLKGINDARG